MEKTRPVIYKSEGAECCGLPRDTEAPHKERQCQSLRNVQPVTKGCFDSTRENTGVQVANTGAICGYVQTGTQQSLITEIPKTLERSNYRRQQPMPAHDPEFKDKTYEIHILAAEKKDRERIPDGHTHVTLTWLGGVRQWRIDGLLEPQSPFLKPKHNWQTHDTLPQGQGDALVKFLEWVQWLIEEVVIPEPKDSSKDVEEASLLE